MRYFQVYFSNTVAFRKNYSCIELSCLYCSLICKLKLKYGIFFEKQSSSWASCILAVCRGDEILPEIFHFDSCQVWQLSGLTAVKSDSCQIRQLSANACRIYECLTEFAMIFWAYFLYYFFSKEFLTKKYA